ncbi:MAG: hypothetical protein WA891_15475 [Acidobacteriaceae bacterium]|jgi:hypothetical protein
MAPECTFILPNGKKCRAAANHNLTLCRHHAPKPAVLGSPRPKSQIYSRLARWRELGRNLPWLPLDEIPTNIHNILDSLIDRGPGLNSGEISDLTAGRFLRALLNRLGDVPFPHPDHVPAQDFTSRLAPDLQSALAALPGPGRKLDPQAANALISAFANNGLIPPGVAADFRSSHS